MHALGIWDQGTANTICNWSCTSCSCGWNHWRIWNQTKISLHLTSYQLSLTKVCNIQQLWRKTSTIKFWRTKLLMFQLESSPCCRIICIKVNQNFIAWRVVGWWDCSTTIGSKNWTWCGITIINCQRIITEMQTVNFHL